MLSIPLLRWRPEGQGSNGGGGERRRSAPVRLLPRPAGAVGARLLDVHAQSVDLPGGGRQVALQLKLSLSQPGKTASLICETCAIKNEGHRKSDKEFAARGIRATLLASRNPGQGQTCGQT